MYNLAEQTLLKTLTPGIRWISSMDVHPSGDHLIVGGYDRKLCWFDLELSDKPYKVLRCVALSFSMRYHGLPLLWLPALNFSRERISTPTAAVCGYRSQRRFLLII